MACIIHGYVCTIPDVGGHWKARCVGTAGAVLHSAAGEESACPIYMHLQIPRAKTR